MSGRNLLLFGFKDNFPPNSFSLESSLIKTFMGASHIIKTIYFLSVLLKEFLSLSVCQRISKHMKSVYLSQQIFNSEPCVLLPDGMLPDGMLPEHLLFQALLFGSPPLSSCLCGTEGYCSCR